MPVSGVTAALAVGPPHLSPLACPARVPRRPGVTPPPSDSASSSANASALTSSVIRSSLYKLKFRSARTAQQSLCDCMAGLGPSGALLVVMSASSIGAGRGGGYARYLDGKTIAPEQGD